MELVNLLNGIAVESKTTSLTGKYLYSDYAIQYGVIQKNSILNDLSKIWVIGILAGIARIALGIIHVLGHLAAAVFTSGYGHLWHAAKGGCEMLRGLIEALPIIGRIFAINYLARDWDTRSWWMIKMYNPDAPDGLDDYMRNWDLWRRSNPAYYVIA